MVRQLERLCGSADGSVPGRLRPGVRTGVVFIHSSFRHRTTCVTSTRGTASAGGCPVSGSHGGALQGLDPQGSRVGESERGGGAGLLFCIGQ